MKIVFISPCFNAERNLENLCTSLKVQNDTRWSSILIDDISEDKTWEMMQSMCVGNERFTCHKNTSKKYALRNIVETARLFQDRDDVVIATIDGDDQQCNEAAVSLLLDEYEKGADVVWTAHRWDINSMNISQGMPNNVDPYAWQWSSSHLRSFKASLLKEISDDNFKDVNGEWFKRGYDQALMLPVLSLARERKYIDEICYLYNINSVSMTNRDWEEMDQISTINLVRARGFLS